MWNAKMSTSAKLFRMTAGLLTTNASIFLEAIFAPVLMVLRATKLQVTINYWLFSKNFFKEFAKIVMNVAIQRIIAEQTRFVKILSDRGRAFARPATKETGSSASPKRKSSAAPKIASQLNSACTTSTRTSTAASVLLATKLARMAAA